MEKLTNRKVLTVAFPKAIPEIGLVHGGGRHRGASVRSWRSIARCETWMSVSESCRHLPGRAGAAVLYHFGSKSSFLFAMKVVGLLSGGKDSCFNLVHCHLNGHELVAAASLGPGKGKGPFCHRLVLHLV